MNGETRTRMVFLCKEGITSSLPLSRAVSERNVIMREGINSPELAPPAGPFSHVVKAGGLLYLSGQLAQNPQTGLVGATWLSRPHRSSTISARL